MFRKAAIEASRSRHWGDVISAQPPSSTILTAFSATTACVLLAIFTLGSYTQHTSVVGRLVPQGGIAKVSPPFPGTITAKHVVDGQAVKVGDILYVISDERKDASGNAILSTVAKYISARRNQLMQDISAMEQSQRIEEKQWRQRLKNQFREVDKYGELIVVQQQLVTLARNSANRYRGLQLLGAVSKEQAEKAQADFHDKQSRLYALERDRVIA